MTAYHPHTTDAYRPRFHYSVPTGWMNDPNGLVYDRGWYHLYYQYNPADTRPGPMHWGHARSRDFVRWETLPIALRPDALGTIFSGSMADDLRNTSGFGTAGHYPLVAVFTHHLDLGEGRYRECQSLAYSLDGGLTFDKYAGNPVVTDPNPDFRDPHVFWHEGSGRWVMAAVAGRKVQFYSSPDLKSWEYLSTFSTGNAKPAGIWECPSFFRARVRGTGETKWVLIVSVNDPDGSYSGMEYFVGDFNGRSFTSETPEDEIRMLDAGVDHYACAAYHNIPGRTVVVGWMNCWQYGQKIPSDSFRGSMTVPREIELMPDGGSYRVRQRPVRELDGCFGPPEESDARAVPLPGSALMIELETSLAQSEWRLIGGHSVLGLRIDALRGLVTLDRSRCGHAELGPAYTRSFSAGYRPSGGISRFTLLLDTCSLELFSADGTAALTMQVFPDSPFERLERLSPAEPGKARVSLRQFREEGAAYD